MELFVKLLAATGSGNPRWWPRNFKLFSQLVLMYDQTWETGNGNIKLLPLNLIYFYPQLIKQIAKTFQWLYQCFLGSSFATGLTSGNDVRSELEKMAVENPRSRRTYISRNTNISACTDKSTAMSTAISMFSMSSNPTNIIPSGHIARKSWTTRPN